MSFRQNITLALGFAVTLSLLPASALTAEQDATGLYPHQPEHTQGCGCITAAEGKPYSFACKERG